jgi:type I restriction enzyme R subunit
MERNKSSRRRCKLTDKDKRELKPIERIKLIATRGQDDPKNV